MPNYKGHLCGGFVAYIVVLFFCMTTRPSFLIGCEWLLCTLAGSLFPDIDVKSRGQKYFYYVVLILFIFLLYQEHYKLLSCISILTITPMLSRHRGIFHNPYFLIIMPMTVWLILTIVPLGMKLQLQLQHILFFVLGALSHVFFDRHV